jgi:TonB family protein
MDDRTLVPPMLPVVPLDGHTSIPANLPLESIAARVVVPRDVNREAYSVVEDVSAPVQPTDLDSRIAVPQGAAPLEIAATPVVIPEDLVEPDVFMTGEVHLVPEPATEDKSRKELIRRITRISSFAVHIAIIALIILQAKYFPSRQPSAAEQEIARKQYSLILPPGAFESSRPEIRPTPPAPKVRVDPRVLREVAPPAPQPPPPTPTPQPERPVRELPSAPVAKPNAAPPEPQPDAPVAKTTEAPKLKLETPDMPQPQHQGLVLPKESTNRSLRDTIRDTARTPSSGGRSGGIIGPMPRSSAQTPGGGAGQGGTYGNGYEILTPTEGVDFSDYMARVIASVRRNWYAVMPESALLGDRGRVALQFRIMKDGSVPDGEPVRLLGSGKEPLDRAAVSAIRSSNPFEPLPPAFKGPYIELRFYFLYNLPLEAAYQ